MHIPPNYIDSGFVISISPYMRLLGERSAKLFIDYFCEFVIIHEKLLNEWPEAKYEQLEITNFTIQALQIMDEELIDDFLNHCFRGACLASWLIALSPDEKYLSKLNNFLERCHEGNRWIANLAVSSILNRECEYLEKVRIISSHIKRLPSENISIRKSPTKEELVVLDAEKKKIAYIYENLGADSAIEYLKKSPNYYYIQSFRDWYRSNAKKI